MKKSSIKWLDLFWAIICLVLGLMFIHDSRGLSLDLGVGVLLVSSGFNAKVFDGER